MSRIRLSSPSSRGFTLIELLVVIAVVLILAAIALPTLMSAVRQGKRAKCAANLKQIASVLIVYRNAYDGFMHYSGTRGLAPPEAILDLLDDPDIFVCPIDATPGDFNWWTLQHDRLTRASYMWNQHIMTSPIRWRDVDKPQEVGLVSDGRYVNNGLDWRNARKGVRVDWDHGNGAVNILFGDQRVERVPPAELGQVRSPPR